MPGLSTVFLKAMENCTVEEILDTNLKLAEFVVNVISCNPEWFCYQEDTR